MLLLPLNLDCFLRDPSVPVSSCLDQGGNLNVDGNALNAGTSMSKYRDVTSVYQAVTPRPHYGVLNTRNDDVVYLRLQSGGSICLEPNSETVFTDSYRVNGIKISSSSTCRHTP